MRQWANQPVLTYCEQNCFCSHGSTCALPTDRTAKTIITSSSWHWVLMASLNATGQFVYSEVIMLWLEKRPLSLQEKLELTPHLLELFILGRREASGWLMVAAPLMGDRTHLHTEDFEGFEGEHQAVNHFVCLWSKCTWQRHEQKGLKPSIRTTQNKGKWPGQTI